MKLVRFAANNDSPVLLGALIDDSVLDLRVLPEWAGLGLDAEGAELSDLWLSGENPCGLIAAALERGVDEEGLLPLKAVRLLAPIERPGKIICIGMNYRDHCAELGMSLPEFPVVFAKFQNALLDPDSPIIRPRLTKQLDYEAELVVVIGQGGRHIAELEALRHVAGYMNGNDVSARNLQFQDGQWVRAKSCETFAPMGPMLVTRDEIPDPQDLSIVCRVNGEERQRSHTGEMVFPVSYIVAFLSQFMTLEAGDVIFTGTPPGVAMSGKPPRYLEPGDVVEIEIEKLGVLRNPVLDE